VNDENGCLLADSQNILNIWKNYFPQLMNVHSVSDIRQIEIHILEPLVRGPSCLEAEIALAKLRTYKSPDNDRIVAELIPAGCKTILPAIHWGTLYGISTNYLISGRSV
jgi:hypothetical protein